LTLANTWDKNWPHIRNRVEDKLGKEATSLIHRARLLCDRNSLPQELEFLTTIFKDNGYSQQQINHAMKPATQTDKDEDKPTSTAYLPYTQTIFGRLSRMLAKYNIKSIALPPKKIAGYLPPYKCGGLPNSPS
jgi:hypothetical protein